MPRENAPKQGKAPGRAGYSSHAALAMARASKRLAAKYDDEDLARHAAELERRALDAIEQGLEELPDESAGQAWTN